MNLPKFNQLSKSAQLSLIGVFVLSVGLFAAVLGSEYSQDQRSKASTGQSVTSFSLMNGNNGSVISQITNGSSFALSSLPTTCLSIRANTNPTTVGSLVFGYDGNSN